MFLVHLKYYSCFEIRKCVLFCLIELGDYVCQCISQLKIVLEFCLAIFSDFDLEDELEQIGSVNTNGFILTLLNKFNKFNK